MKTPGHILVSYTGFSIEHSSQVTDAFYWVGGEEIERSPVDKVIFIKGTGKKSAQ